MMAATKFSQFLLSYVLVFMIDVMIILYYEPFLEYLGETNFIQFVLHPIRIFRGKRKKREGREVNF